MKKYILADDGKTPVVVDDMLIWGRWFETAPRHVALDSIGNVKVSTVFLGLDHNFMSGPLPLLWETMVFGGPLNEEMERYSSYDDAVTGHAAMLKRVREAKETNGG